MTDSWKFCPTSEPAVSELRNAQACPISSEPAQAVNDVNNAQNPTEPAVSDVRRAQLQSREERNKWLDKFREDNIGKRLGTGLYNLLKTSAYNRDKWEDAEAGIVQVKPKPVNPVDAYCEAIEAEPVASFDYMLEQGTRNSALFKALAQKISGLAVEKICKQLLERKDIHTQYINSFFRNFFPVYLKRGYSWFSLDILVKTNKAYPLAFRTLLQILLQDLDVSNTMINDFVLTLDETGKYEFLSTVMELELSTDEFIHNLVPITSAYKGAEKSERLQSYILDSLMEHSAHCHSDWNYGRLLLAYLNALSNGENNFDIRMVERLIEMHRSPFKRPCMSVLSAAIKALNEAAIPPNPS